MKVTVIGAGLAGSECAWQLAQRGIQVRLCEMKPEKMTPAHTTEYFAELCCSNSLRGAALENAVGDGQHVVSSRSVTTLARPYTVSPVTLPFSTTRSTCPAQLVRA